ncbi:putative tyrosine-protein kinase [Apostichopus japonicus]|uniref:Putative tyrosine-protein kinase n=1 Tax=Stichopus japonicus TaxID=307972 RepID=A0A2G8JTH4_STIJA|nr:putative tyrosine-protein kinase [Apostichopus japonicus]
MNYRSHESWNRERAKTDNSTVEMTDTTRGGSISRQSISHRTLPNIPVRPDLPKIPSNGNVSDGSNESENEAFRRKDIHWDEFVKRTLDLPVTKYLVKVEGIGILKAKLHLVQEHFACETLDSWLVKVFSQETFENTMYLSEVMGIIAGLLEGLNLIHSYGFLHPGLSSKKILRIEKGQCKLYDFCLSDDASKITTFRKTKVPYSLNHFPPEALHRNEYSQPSDVWAAAGVIWEVITGQLPFPWSEDGPTFEEQCGAPSESQVTHYEEIRNKQLYQCWHQVCPQRPTIRELRESYQEIFEKLVDNTYEIPRMDLYTSMKSSTIHNKDGGEVYTDTYTAVP